MQESIALNQFGIRPAARKIASYVAHKLRTVASKADPISLDTNLR